MQKHKTDRRIERTHRLMRDALVTLILEKGYEKVTIQDIIDRANVGRSTFYAHYRDKEDLLLRGVAEIAYGETVDQTVRENMTNLEHSGLTGTLSTFPMFSHVKENELLHKAMFEQNKDNAILEKGSDYLNANIQAQLAGLLKPGQEPSVPLAVLALFLTGGLITLMKWWLDHGMPYSPQEMDELFQQIAMPGVWKVLGKEDPS